MKKNRSLVFHTFLFIFLCLMLASCVLIPAEPDPGVELTLTPTLYPTQTLTPTTSPTVTPTPPPFSLQSGVPAYIPNFAHPDAGCQWMGIAGQIFGSQDQPLINQVVVAWGNLSGREMDEVALTGLPEGYAYGPGGYELVLSDVPVQSNQTIMLQVFNLEGHPLSLPVPINTYADCDKNLIIVNFVTE